MRHSIRVALLATTLAVGGLTATAPVMPAAAQYFRADYNGFHDALARDGDWVYSDRWGVVWIPDNVPDDFRPYYTRGHWVYTDDDGFVWSSGYRWGDITFHYGRWVNDPDDGWMWIPGYVWSPGWVTWRSNARYTGWMPMPPDDAFLRGDEGSSFSVGFRFGGDNDFFGYSRWYGRDYNEDRYASNWTFVGTRDLGASDYRARAVRGPQVVNIIRTTNNVTNYTVINDRVVNRSIGVQAVVQAGGRPIRPVHINAVIKTPGLIGMVSQGRAVQLQARRDRPRGNGQMNSAPTPSANVILTLSPRGPRVVGGFGGGGGRPPQHLFTRDTIGNAPFRPGMPGAAPPPRPGMMGPPPRPGMMGPPPPNGPNGGPPPNGGPSNNNGGRDNGGRDWRNRGGENGPNGAPPPNTQGPANAMPAPAGVPNGSPMNGGQPNGGGRDHMHGGAPNGAAPATPPAGAPMTPSKPPAMAPTTPMAPKPTPPAAAPAMPPKPPVTVPTAPMTPKPTPPAMAPTPPPSNTMAPMPPNGGAHGGGFRDHGGSGTTQGGAAPIPGTVPGTPAPSSGAAGEPREHREHGGMGGGMNGPGGAPPSPPAMTPAPPAPKPVMTPPAPVTPPPKPATTPPAPPPPADDRPHKEHPDKDKDKTVPQ